LTEGIDVPAVDMVVFIDPRHSRVDIAQAMGRAMRKPSGSDKTIGYVVVPLFLERKKDETLEEALQRSNFDNVADILNAMQEQDEDLVQIIREMQEAKGRGEVFNPRKLTDKIEVLGPSIELSTLRSNIFVEAVDRIGVSWDEWYGRLKRYKEREGHCRIPRAHKENGYELGRWVNKQRTKKEEMSTERRTRLETLGFIWDTLSDQWEEGFTHLMHYKDREGHCRVPALYLENGFRLGSWVRNQRVNKNAISSQRCARLERLGFEWDILSNQWENGFRYLKAYKEREGHCRVPAGHKENGFDLGKWVSKQRTRNETIPSARQKQLEELGFVWDARSDQWKEGLVYLKAYKDREGNCRVPHNHKENGFALGSWVQTQRTLIDNISVERRAHLDSLGFEWNISSYKWKVGLEISKGFQET
jgi:hypothetical protein